MAAQITGIIDIEKVAHMQKDDKLINLTNRQIVTVVKADPLTTLTDVTYYDYDLEKDVTTTISQNELEDYKLILEVNL